MYKMIRHNVLVNEVYKLVLTLLKPGMLSPPVLLPFPTMKGDKLLYIDVNMDS